MLHDRLTTHDEIRFIAASGDVFIYKFQPQHVNEVYRALWRQRCRGLLTNDNIDMADGILRNLAAHGDLPGKKHWLDLFCEWCFGK